MDEIFKALPKRPPHISCTGTGQFPTTPSTTTPAKQELGQGDLISQFADREEMASLAG